MFPRTKNRKAISTVLTTLIILVASVVLGTGVVLYGTSLFQTGAQSQAISAQGVKVWVNATDTNNVAWGAAEIRNSGDKLLSVDKIDVRGTSIPFSNWYADSDPTRVTSANFQSSLNYTQTDANGMMKDSANSGYSWSGSCTGVTGTILKIDEDGATGTKPGLCLQQKSGPLTLKPGDQAIVYFHVPNGVLTTIDAGASSSVAIYAGQVGAPQSVTIASK